MNKFIVSYDIPDSPKRNEIYINLLNVLPKIGGTRKLVNVWEFESNLMKNDLTSKIKNIIGADSSLMVAKVTENPDYYNLKDLD